MLRHQPKANFSGLTIVMSNPSRFDKWTLLSGTGGMYFQECLYPHLNRYQCDIRLRDDKSPLLPNTKCLLVMGEAAQKQLANVDTSIEENRGSPLVYNPSGIPIISTFSAQDTKDPKNYEADYNTHLQTGGDYQSIANDISKESGDNNPVMEKRRHGKTSRSNYAFWFKKDVEKAIIITQHGSIPTPSINPSYIIYPSSDDISAALRSVKNGHLYFDIETDANLNITCFSFSFGLPNIYVVPVISHDYSPAYASLVSIFQSLAIAIRDNILVAHNGAGFDFFVLAHKYKTPIGRRVYDTMLAQNRCFPEVEKSLGHCISLPWMFEPYHKNEGNFAYGTQKQAMDLWKYCGKDVYSLILLKKAQDEYASKRVGLRESIAAVNSYVRPYLIATLFGINYSKQELDNTIAINDRLCNQYLRILDILIGKDWIKRVRRKGKSSLPSSNPQCVMYFHELLKYPVVGKTKTGKPSLGKKHMYKLKLKFPSQVVIDIVIAYRTLAKESGSLKFISWKE